ncbi:MAG: methylenetetrahydrofolate reductase (NADPH) [Planctomycetota bacterium]
MKISDLYDKGKTVISFEFFPPKTDAGAAKLMETVADLKSAVEPDFVSVTYGAGGSTRERTHQVVTQIQNELDLLAMAHQTCVAASKDEIRRGIQSLVDAGITNVLALRGDPPEGESGFIASEDGFNHATDLLQFLGEEFDICLGAACYPEDHPESSSQDDDMKWTIAKQKAGAGFLVTQLFFDNRFYFDAVARAREQGLTVPIIPGIMPVTNVSQVERFTKMCGATIPQKLLGRLRRHQDDPAAVMATGIEWAITQCRELIEGGAPGLHFYTLNKSHATRSIVAAVRD